MSRQNIIAAILVVIAAGLVLWLVSPDQEQKAKSALDAAYKIEQSGQLDEAVVLYEALIKEYDGTEAARSAVESIGRVEKYKERQAIQAVQKYLGRINLVLNGYREMLGSSPRSISDLDNENYIFDSGYVVSIVPEGMTCYLRFEKEGGYTLYSHKEGEEKVVKRFNGNQMAVLSLAEFEAELAAPGYERQERERMVFLQPLP